MLVAGGNMERGIPVGAVVLVPGMITFGLGMYFVDAYSISHPGSILALVGGVFTILGLLTLVGEGALRFLGLFFLVIGGIGFVAGLLAGTLQVPTTFGWFLASIGLWLGPVFMLIGLGALVVSDRRKRAAISAV